jgi:hypothetical protein
LKRRQLSSRKKNKNRDEDTKSILRRLHLEDIKEAVGSLIQETDQLLGNWNQVQVFLFQHEQRMKEGNKPGNMIVKVQGSQEDFRECLRQKVPEITALDTDSSIEWMQETNTTTRAFNLENRKKIAELKSMLQNV